MASGMKAKSRECVKPLCIANGLPTSAKLSRMSASGRNAKKSIRPSASLLSLNWNPAMSGMTACPMVAIMKVGGLRDSAFR